MVCFRGEERTCSETSAYNVPVAVVCFTEVVVVVAAFGAFGVGGMKEGEKEEEREVGVGVEYASAKLYVSESDEDEKKCCNF